MRVAVEAASTARRSVVLLSGSGALALPARPACQGHNVHLLPRGRSVDCPHGRPGGARRAFHHKGSNECERWSAQQAYAAQSMRQTVSSRLNIYFMQEGSAAARADACSAADLEMPHPQHGQQALAHGAAVGRVRCAVLQHGIHAGVCSTWVPPAEHPAMPQSPVNVTLGRTNQTLFLCKQGVLQPEVCAKNIGMTTQ